MYVSYETPKTRQNTITTQHRTHTEKNKSSKQQGHSHLGSSSRLFQSRQPTCASIHPSHLARVFFFQLEEQVGSGFGPLLPVTSPFPAHSLRLPCPAFNYYTLACPRRIYTTPRPGAAVHRTTEYIAQYYLCPRCTSQPVRTSVPRSTSSSTYTSTSTSPRYISLSPPSLPGWWFLTLTIPPPLLPAYSSFLTSGLLLSCLTTSLSSTLSLSRPPSLFFYSLVCLFCISFPIRALRSRQERVRTLPPARPPPLSCHAWHCALTRHLHIPTSTDPPSQ